MSQSTTLVHRPAEQASCTAQSSSSEARSDLNGECLAAASAPLNLAQPSASTSQPSASASALASSFQTTTAFFSACTAHLQATHGIKAWKREETKTTLDTADQLKSDWTLTSRCRGIRELVAGRETIFEGQRQNQNGEEHQQQQLVDLAQQCVDGFKTPSIPVSPIASSLDLWRRFCAQQDVPAFPISSGLVALCIWKLSVKHTLDFYPFLIVMEKLRIATTMQLNAKDVEMTAESLLESDAITEFLDERRRKLSGVDGSVGGPPSALSVPVIATGSSAVNSSSTPSQQHRASSTNDQAPVIPNVPKIGDRFACAEDLIEHYRQTVVPVLGVGLWLSTNSGDRRYARCNHGRNTFEHCPYRIHLHPDEDSGGYVISTSSHFKHNHGPRPQILADPSWRPRFGPRKKRAKQQMETTDEQINTDEEEDPDAGHASVPEPAPLPPALILAPAVKRSAPSIAVPSVAKKPRSDQTLSLVLAAASTAFSAPKPGRLGQPRLSAPVPTLADAARPIPSPRLSLSPSTRVTQSPSHDNSPFLPVLVLFLTSLLPSLPSAAAPLFDAGLRDASSLVAFVGLSDDVREVLLKETQVPLVQRHLLMSKLKLARTTGWKTT